MQHQMTRGMQVSMGWTCACRWWSGEAERENAKLPFGEKKNVIVEHQAEMIERAINGNPS